MFGLFNKNNPDREYFNELNRLSEQAARFMLFVKLKRCIPAQDGMDDIPLDIEENRLKVVDCFNNVIKDNSIDTEADIEKILMKLALEVRQGNSEQVYENTLAFMSNANLINDICKVYYVEFPKSDKLFEIVNNLAKIFSPAFIVIFGDSMPEPYRKIWPYLSNIFEHYKTHKGI